ncbi:hypothetical protein [Rugosimonospora africana]|uniref:Nal1 N-terminal domain-containing protein n=1 Tax=Rugosimonospora africana TaxID=556532 RepID=A0A8J3QV87_9ACTN|nr:hypothetical protein [Rugosimonospora africana]GIH17116.1 hypothetical protein Raf01_52880 [Rugosimonospora africana]
MKLDPDTAASLHRAKQALFRAHLNDPTFTGCAVGLRWRNGVQTDEPAVIAMVNKKLTERQVSPRRALPRTLDTEGRAVGVDVVEVARPYAVPRPYAAPRSDASPDAIGWPILGKQPAPIQGCDISMVDGAAPGALGCLVRDNEAGDICVLSSNYVMANLNQGPASTLIIQPSAVVGGTSGDGIARLRRWIPLVPNGSGAGYADAAIARLDNQSSYSRQVVNNLMPPITAGHPAVGMVAAWDDEFRNCFLSRMDRVVAGLDISLLPADGSSAAACVAAPELLMHIEKVGPATGYTSSVVDAVGAIVKVDYGNGTVYVLQDLIWTQAFHWDGDSGAVACVGGNGREYVPTRNESGCVVLDSIGKYYNLPLTGDNALTSQARDQFLSQSQVGNLIIGVIYNNSHLVAERLGGYKGTGQEQGYAKTYYNKYHDLFAAVLGDPGSGQVVTQENLSDAGFILSGLFGGPGTTRPMLIGDEAAAAEWVYQNVLLPTQGMDYYRVLDYMNDPDVYQSVYNKLASLTSIELVGPIYGDTPPLWADASHVDTNTSIALTSSVGLGNESSLIFTTVPGAGIWSRTCTGGVWSSSATKIDTTATVPAIASVLDADGVVHLFIASASGVWERTLGSTGTWSASTRVDTNTSVVSLAAALDAGGVTHLFTGVSGSGVWDRTYSGAWAATATKIDATTTVAGLAAARDGSGTLRLFVTATQSGVSTRAYAAGTWSASSSLDANTAIAAVAAATTGDGRTHLVTLVPTIGVYDRQLRAGTWDVTPVLVDGATGIAGISASSATDGGLHLQTRVTTSGVWDRRYTPGT